MREAVIVEEHDDGDPEEAADRRHAAIMPVAPAGSGADQTFRPGAYLGTFQSMSPRRTLS